MIHQFWEGEERISTARLCKDCKWCEPAWGFGFSRLKWEFANCVRTAVMEDDFPSPVDGFKGKPRRRITQCSIERTFAFDGRCGEAAKHFEARRPTFNSRFLILILILLACLAIVLMKLAAPAHADGPVASAIGGLISAMEPTSTSPDNYSDSDGDDDE
jgi:hypothetical protein